MLKTLTGFVGKMNESSIIMDEIWSNVDELWLVVDETRKKIIFRARSTLS